MLLSLFYYGYFDRIFYFFKAFESFLFLFSGNFDEYYLILVYYFLIWFIGLMDIDLFLIWFRFEDIRFGFYILAILFEIIC